MSTINLVLLDLAPFSSFGCNSLGTYESLEEMKQMEHQDNVEEEKEKSLNRPLIPCKQ